MRIWVELLHGQTLLLKVTPQMTIRELKERTWEDEVSRDTTVVERWLQLFSGGQHPGLCDTDWGPLPSLTAIR